MKKAFFRLLTTSCLCFIWLLTFVCSNDLWAQSLSPDREVRKLVFNVQPPGYDPVRHDMCIEIIKQWKKIGIDVELAPLDDSVMFTKGLKNHDFDMMIYTWGGNPERIDPDYFIFSFLDSSQDNINLLNMDGYNNPEYDKLARKQRVTMDPEERRKIIFKAQETFVHDQPETPIVHRNGIQAYNNIDFKEARVMMGEGLNFQLNFVSISPTGSRKILRYGHPQDIITMNPTKVVGAHSKFPLVMVWDRLMAVDPEGKVIPWAAKEAKIVDDRTIDVTLREGMKFHDGLPVTADDVKFTFDYLQRKNIASFAASLKPLDSVEKIGDLKVRFKLKEPYAAFLSYTLSYVYILPKHVWENIPEKVGLKQPDDWTDWKALAIGSGPFKYEYWRRGEELKLTRFESHFSKPKIDGILRIVYGDMQSLVMAMEKQEIDMVGWNISPIQAKTLGKLKHVTIVNVPDHGFMPIHYNCRIKPFSDVAFRRALAYAIPKERIANEFYEGYAVPADSTIGSMNKFWHNPNVEKIRFDLEKARKILKDAGYEWDSKGKLYYPK